MNRESGTGSRLVFGKTGYNYRLFLGVMPCMHHIVNRGVHRFGAGCLLDDPRAATFAQAAPRPTA